MKDKRFVDLTGSPELASCSKGYVPPNTQANTQWSVRTFNSWMDWRIKAKPVDPVPKDIFTCGDAKLLNKWLLLFVLEARKLYNDSTFNDSMIVVTMCSNHSAICEILAVQYIIYWHSEPLI